MLVPPQEENRPASGVSPRSLSESGEVDPVEQELVGAAEMAVRQLGRRLGDRHPGVDAAGEATRRAT